MDAGAATPVTLTVNAGDLSADLETIDCLARLALLARRNGGRIVVRDCSDELRDLIALAGLEEVLPDG